MKMTSMAFGLAQRHAAIVLLVGAAACSLTRAGHAGQHLVAPGNDWASLADRVRPGDEIILMPGKHRGAEFQSLIGTHDKPITIRGIDAENPAQINGDKDGIRIHQAAHLLLKDLSVSDCSISGITLSAPSAPAQEQEVSGQRIIIRNVKVSRIGPKGLRHGICLTGLEDVRIAQCRFDGWGGSAIEIIACHDVVVEESAFHGLADHTQENGVRVRAGSDRVRIERCRFEEAGTRVVCLGGPSLIEEFAAPLPDHLPKDARLYEVERTNVEGCIFLGGKCAVVFSNAEDCVARNNTIVRPTHCVFAILAEQADPRFGAGKRLIWGFNIAAWEPGDIQRMVEYGKGINPEAFFLEQNLWWSSNFADQRRRLGAWPGKDFPEQTTTVNPGLDANLKPTAAGARGFGAS